MNSVAIALVWCVVQVTILGMMSGGLYLVVRRLRPAAAAPVALTGLLTVVLLSALALVPWPRWSLAGLVGWDQRSAGPPELAEQGTVGRRSPRELVPPYGDSAQPIRGQDAAGEGLSRALLWWQGLVGELSRAEPIAPETPWRWPAVVAALVLTGMVAGAGWLLLGLLAVRSQRARSRPVEAPALLELIDTLRADLGCRRRVEVRQSSDLITAATIGWRRPVILLPTEWTAWTAAQRRAVLAHEIAHVRRNDFLAVLCGQVGLVLHFYHPLLHWLMARLRLEQELAADADAASVSGGRRQYLMTIAELALQQPTRPLLWPARSFLPTQTTLLRRIAMLRDANLRFDRLSPMARTLVVGVVLGCGVLVAGLRAPGNIAPALAGSAEPTAASAASEGPDEIDKTFFTETAAGIIVMRPAAVLARPGLGDLAALLEQSVYVVPKPFRLAEFRQITMIEPGTEEPRSGLREVLAFQSVKPLALTSLMQHAPAGITAKEYQGKKIYADPLGRNVVMQYDDRTLMTFGSEEAMRVYFAAKRGVLPKWLPSEAWDTLRGDHFVAAVDAKRMRRDMKAVVEHQPPIARAAMLPFSAIWQDTTWIGIGTRQDRNLTAHAWLEGQDADGADRLLRTADVLRMLAQNALKDVRRQLGASRRPDAGLMIGLVDTAEPLLAGMKIEQQGNAVRISASTEIDARTLVSVAVAARKAAARAMSVNNLKQIALAMHMYHDKHKHFPPAVLYGPDGKTPYSWRVALLPFLNLSQAELLYKQYRFDEPWDGPNNRRLADTRVAVYQCPGEAAQSANASYFVLAGPGTAFEKKTRPSLADVRDGSSNTIMILEAKRNIPWSKPEDIPYDPNKPLPQLGGHFDDGFHVALCDGSVHFLPNSIPEKTLRALITRAGGEPVDWNAFSRLPGGSPSGTREKLREQVREKLRKRP